MKKLKKQARRAKSKKAGRKSLQLHGAVADAVKNLKEVNHLCVRPKFNPHNIMQQSPPWVLSTDPLPYFFQITATQGSRRI
jgi:hypothetical protein